MNKIKFQEEVLNAFNFLIDVYGYKCVVSEQDFVRFESELFYLNLHFDRRRSFEVGIEIGEKLKGAPSERIGYNFGEILRYFGAPEANEYSFIQISTTEGMSELIPMIAGLLRKYASELLMGRSDILNGLAKLREREILDYSKQMDLQNLLPRADKAWQEKRYRDYVTLVLPLRDRLPKSLLAKLAYAEKRIEKENANRS